MTYQPQHKARWSHDEIRSARQAHLKPVLENLGYRLTPINNGNYEVCGLSCSVIIKENYWICTNDQNAACAELCRSGHVDRSFSEGGNSIDFCTKVLNMSFNQAMNIIMTNKPYDETGTTLRSQRGNTGGFIQK